MYDHARTSAKNNRITLENRTNMFKGNFSYADTYGKGSTKPRKELTEKKKREVRSWTDEFNRKQSIKAVTITGVVFLLTLLIVYSILEHGVLDAFIMIWEN